MKIYTKKCDTCGKQYTGYGKYYCSPKCQPRLKHTEKSKEKMCGANRYNWKGKRASYFAIHIWLKNNYGKADKCENPNCSCKNPKRYEWALIKGKKHDHNRDNYWKLCKSCHSKYDGIDKITSKRFWKGGKPNCKNCGKQLSTYKNKTSLCIQCNIKLNHPRLGKFKKIC